MEWIRNIERRFGESQGKLMNWVRGIRATGYMVDRKEYGEIYFSKKDINKGLRYADTSEEKAALAVLPQVLKHGIEIGGHGQHEGRSKQTITFAVPVELNGIRGNMAVVVNWHGNHYYAYKIVLPDGTAFRFAEEKTMQHKNCPGEWPFPALLPTPQVLHPALV